MLENVEALDFDDERVARLDALTVVVRDKVFVDVADTELVRVATAVLDGKDDRDDDAVADDELDASTPTPANFRDTGFAAGCSGDAPCCS